MADDAPGGEMSHMEFLRAQFFSAGTPPDKRQPKRRSRKTHPDILALERFVVLLEAMHAEARAAAILYLTDRYLGRGAAAALRRYLA